MSTKEAVEELIRALNADEGYRHSWKANIAMAFIDEWNAEKEFEVRDVRNIANLAADRFLNLLCADSRREKK